LRNVAVVGHSNSGKTSLVEALLFDAGATERLGSVEEGTTVGDFDDEETRRQISISTTLCATEYSGLKLNILDCPGYADFFAEVVHALNAADSGVVVLDASSGVGVGTERAWKVADRRRLPRLIFINKLDKENTSFDESLERVRERLTGSTVTLSLPIDSAGSMSGVVDLLSMKAFVGKGRDVKASEIPAEVADAAQSARGALVEAVASTDEALMERYFEEEDLPQEELTAGLLRAVVAGNLVPVLAGSATANVGVQPLLAAIREILPAPPDIEMVGHKPGASADDESARVTRRTVADAPTLVTAFRSIMHPYQGKLNLVRVWAGHVRSDMSLLNSTREQKERLGDVFTLRGKTQEKVDEATTGDIVGIAKIHGTRTGDTLCDPGSPIVITPPKTPEPMFSASLVVKERSDVDKVAAGLARTMEEDPAFRFFRDQETDESIISGVGRLHLEVIISKVRSATGAAIEMGRPKIPYRETVRKAHSVHHRYKKQTGGRGQFGDVQIRVEPQERGGGFEFLDEVVGGSIPRQYIPAVEKGVIEAMQRGVLAGFPVVDLRVAVFDGQYHTVDSSEFAFKRAASMAFRKAATAADPILLEPIVRIQVTVPDEHMGDIMGDLSSRRGRVQGTEREGRSQVITAIVPLAEVATYETDLRSLTGGRAMYTMEPSHYEEVPAHLVDGICAEYKREIEEEE
jgi:elongation factor G